VDVEISVVMCLVDRGCFEEICCSVVLLFGINIGTSDVGDVGIYVGNSVVGVGGMNVGDSKTGVDVVGTVEEDAVIVEHVWPT